MVLVLYLYHSSCSLNIFWKEIFVQCCVFVVVVVCLVEVCRPPTRSDTLCLLLLLLLLPTALVLDAAPNTLKNIFDGLSLHHFHCILDACIECHQMYPMTQTLIHRSKPNIFFVNQWWYWFQCHHCSICILIHSTFLLLIQETSTIHPTIQCCRTNRVVNHRHISEWNPTLNQPHHVQHRLLWHWEIKRDWTMSLQCHIWFPNRRWLLDRPAIHIFEKECKGEKKKQEKKKKKRMSKFHTTTHNCPTPPSLLATFFTHHHHNVNVPRWTTYWIDSLVRLSSS